MMARRGLPGTAPHLDDPLQIAIVDTTPGLR